MTRPSDIIRQDTPCASHRLLAQGLLALTLLSGCSGRNVDHPVVGPRPPRISLDEPQALADSPESSSGIVQVASTSTALADGDIAARVNGTPIFVSEVLERHTPKLNAAKGRIPANQLDEMRRQLVREDLDGHIEQALVLHRLRNELDQEQWSKLNERLDDLFYEQEIPRLKKEWGLGSLPEIEAVLQQHGTTLAAYKRVWGNKTLASQWVSDKLPQVKVTPAELRQEYQDRIEEFREPMQVRWQQCWIPIDPADPAKAAAKLDAAVAALRSGATFDEIVTRYSSGARRDTGGHWDWTQSESIADQRLAAALAELKVNEVGPVLESEQGYRLIKLTGRRETRTRSFEEVQNELRESITTRKRSEAAEKLIADLRKAAHVETIFDSEGTF